MNEDLKKQSTEEIDLGQIFNAVGRLFDKFFKFFGNIFKSIFSFLMYFLKAIIDNIIIVSVVVGLAFVIGLYLEKSKPSVYQAEMLVRPHFDSKYQLVSNIGYYNSLLKEKNYTTLSDIFEISNTEAEQLLNFDVKTGPETKNELLKQYDLYLKSLDSSRAQSITYKDFVENRDIYSSELFLITVKSLKKDIFRKLEGGIDSIFSNRYSTEQKRKRDVSLEIKKAVYERGLQRMDSLQAIYLDIVQKEAEKGAAFINVQGLLPLQQEKPKTWEYELFQNEMRIRDSIRVMEQLKVEEDSYYDVLSRFQEVGSESSKLTNKSWFVYPIFAFILLCIVYIIIKIFKYIKNYEIEDR